MSASVSDAIAKLASRQVVERRAAARLLAEQGEAAAPAAVALVEAAGDDDAEVREWVTSALEGLGPPPAELAPKLIPPLHHTQADPAYWAATLLGRLGAEAIAALQPLSQALHDSPHAAVQQRAAWAIGQIVAAAAGTRLAPAIRGPVEVSLKAAAASSDPRLARLASDALAQLAAG